MLASQMVENLQKIIREEGDFPVVDALYCEAQEVYYHHPCSLGVAYVDFDEYLVDGDSLSCSEKPVPVIISYIGTPKHG